MNSTLRDVAESCDLREGQGDVSDPGEWSHRVPTLCEGKRNSGKEYHNIK